MTEAAQQQATAAQALAADQAAQAEMAGGDFEQLLGRKRRPDFQFDDATLDKAERLGRMMASGAVSVPKHLRDRPADCAAIALRALRLNVDPWALADKTYFVNDKLSLEAQAIIAILNGSPELATRLQWEWFGDWKGVKGKNDESPDRGVRVWATLTGETEPRVLTLTMAEVGPIRNSPLWGYNPRQQIGYRSASYWQRLHAPDATMGLRSHDDEPMDTQQRTADPALQHLKRPTTTVGALLGGKVQDVHPEAETISALEDTARREGYEAGKKAWQALTKAQRDRIGDAERDRIAGMGRTSDAERAARAAAPRDSNTGEILTGGKAAVRPDVAEYEGAIKVASSIDDAAVHLDQARSVFGADSLEMEKLRDTYAKTWEKK